MQDSIAIQEGGQNENILVVQTSFLGDVVLTVPLIAEIRRKFPRARLSVLCKTQLKGLLEDHADLDEVIVLDKVAGHKGLTGLWNKAQDLKRREFTIAISPHKSFRTALLLFLARIPCRVGFRQSSGWFLYHYRVSRPEAIHDVERNLSILRAFGIDLVDCRRNLNLATHLGARESVAETFRFLGIKKGEGRFFFGLSPGSVWPMKRWSLEGYASLILALKKSYPCEVLLFGAPEDQRIIAKLQQLTGNCGLDLGGRFGLRELPSAVAWCDLFICNDTGPMHIAVARGVPVVAIFCATTPSLGFYPYSSDAVVVEKKLPCRPCSSHGGLRCPLGTEDCIRLIEPRHVLDAVRTLLNDRKHPNVAADNVYVPRFLTV